MALASDTTHRPASPTAVAYPPQSFFAEWTDLIDAGASGSVNAADNGGSRITQVSQIDGIAKHPLVVHGGTLLELRCAYDKDETGSPTAPVAQVFGNDAADGTGTWELLEDEDGNDEITLAMTPDEDLNDGMFKLSAKAAVDLRGNRRVLVGIKTAHVAGTGGNAALAKLVGKVL